MKRLLALALCLLPLVSAAADAIRWPVAWRAGDHWTYDTESLTRETDEKGTRVTRNTDITDVRVLEAGAQGSAQSWTSRDSYIEAIEGDRSGTDAIAPALAAFDGFAVIFELDGDGHFSKVRNLAETGDKVRQVMLPLTGIDLDAMATSIDPKLTQAQRAAVMAETRNRLDAMMRTIFDDPTVTAMTAGNLKTMTRFAGTDFVPGHHVRGAATIDTPLRGRPLAATRDVVATVDKRDPNLVRVRWTLTLDPAGDADALWDLQAELTRGGLRDSLHPQGRPVGLSLREDGALLFRRDTGVVEMVENTVVSDAGPEHHAEHRYRLRLRDSTRAWADLRR